MTVDVIRVHGTDQDIVQAARLSTLGSEAEPAEAEGLIRYLVRNHHTSPLEQVDMVLRIQAPLFVTRQILTHRTLQRNEESGRYRELEGVFYLPAPDRKVRQVGKTGDYDFVEDDMALMMARGEIERISREAWSSYNFLLRGDVAKEAARLVLPVNVYSTMQVKASLLNWLKFVQRRTFGYGDKPQHEIAMVGDKIKAHLIEHFPVVVDEFDKTYKGY